MSGQSRKKIFGFSFKTYEANEQDPEISKKKKKKKKTIRIKSKIISNLISFSDFVHRLF